MKKGRKIEKMHRLFGIGDGYCKGCIHLIDQRGGGAIKNAKYMATLEARPLTGHRSGRHAD